MFFQIFFSFLFFLSVSQAAEVWDVSGANGIDAINGWNPIGRAFDGSNGFSGGNGGQGGQGQSGGNAGIATAGKNAGNISFYIRMHPTQPSVLLVKGKMFEMEIPEKEFLINNTTHFYLYAKGGRGGHGAPGGDGQDGGNGGNGGDASSFQSRAGNGGNGGNGGNAGKSTNGKNGGNGGAIRIYLQAGEEFLLNYISTEVSGGKGGNAPYKHPNPGRGGSGGQPGNHCYYDMGRYTCGQMGMRGFGGYSGQPNFEFQEDGKPGQAGVVEVMQP